MGCSCTKNKRTLKINFLRNQNKNLPNIGKCDNINYFNENLVINKYNILNNKDINNNNDFINYNNNEKNQIQNIINIQNLNNHHILSENSKINNVNNSEIIQEIKVEKVDDIKNYQEKINTNYLFLNQNYNHSNCLINANNNNLLREIQSIIPEEEDYQKNYTEGERTETPRKPEKESSNLLKIIKNNNNSKNINLNNTEEKLDDKNNQISFKNKNNDFCSFPSFNENIDKNNKLGTQEKYIKNNSFENCNNILINNINHLDLNSKENNKANYQDFFSKKKIEFSLSKSWHSGKKDNSITQGNLGFGFKLSASNSSLSYDHTPSFSEDNSSNKKIVNVTNITNIINPIVVGENRCKNSN